LTIRDRMRSQILYYGGIGREANLIILATSVASFYWGVLSVIPGVYLPQIGFTDVQVGSLYSANGITSAVLGIPLSIWSDRHGRRKGLMIGIALAGFSFFTYAFTTSYSYLLVASIVSGLGFGLFFPTSSALLAERTTETKRTIAFSLSFFVGTAAGALGTLISIVPAFLRNIGVPLIPSYQAVYVLTGIVFLAGIIPAFLVSESSSLGGGFSFPRKSWSMIARYSLFNTVIGLGAGLIIPIFSLWFFIKFRYNETVLAPLNTIATVATALAGLLAPRVADLLGDISSVLLENGIATAILLAMPSVESFPLLGAMFVFRQFLMNMSSPIMSSFYMTHVDPTERAAAAAFSGTAWNFPNSITPAVGGYLMESVSVDLPLYLCGTTYAFSVLLVYLFFYSYRGKRTSHPGDGREPPLTRDA
jgi:MFS family permease